MTHTHFGTNTMIIFTSYFFVCGILHNTSSSLCVCVVFSLPSLGVFRSCVWDVWKPGFWSMLLFAKQSSVDWLVFNICENGNLGKSSGCWAWDSRLPRLSPIRHLYLVAGQGGKCGGTVVLVPADKGNTLQGCSPHISSCEKFQSGRPRRRAGQVSP